MPSYVWDVNIYPFPNFNGCIVDVLECISNFTSVIEFVSFIHAMVKVYPCQEKGPIGYYTIC